ncbi:hypothetical protein TSMEX_010220 [Taenia solium]|eukprot:TsM_000489500 transcript=TsM_000489500 gene=TsM_000489500
MVEGRGFGGLLEAPWMNMLGNNFDLLLEETVV